jgi:serralysin
METKYWRFDKVSAAVVSMLVATGCVERSDSKVEVEVSNERSVKLSWEQYRDRATRPTRVNGKPIYAIDWDIFTDSEEYLRAVYDATFAGDTTKLALFRQLSTGIEPIFSPSAAVELKYCVSNAFQNFPPHNKAQVVTSLQTAMSAWEDVANVRFRYDSAHDGNCTPANANVDVAVVPSTYGDYSGCAGSKLLWSPLGCPITGPFNAPQARGVLAMNYSTISSPHTPVGIMKHELGHILGFRHEHAFAPLFPDSDAGIGLCSGESPTLPAYDATFRQLTAYDQLSVMHYPGICGKPFVDFTLSQPDGEGSRSVYGMPAAWYFPTVL